MLTQLNVMLNICCLSCYFSFIIHFFPCMATMHHSTFLSLDFCFLPPYTFTPLPFSALAPCSFFVHPCNFHLFYPSLLSLSCHTFIVSVCCFLHVLLIPIFCLSRPTSLCSSICFHYSVFCFTKPIKICDNLLLNI
jgi:hypothetical protein